MFVGDIYEDLELWYPKLRLIEAGAEVVIAGPEASTQYQGNVRKICGNPPIIVNNEHRAHVAFMSI